MNKKQTIIAWVGTIFFVFCAWNPSIKPVFSDYPVQVEVTDEEWEQIRLDKRQALQAEIDESKANLGPFTEIAISVMKRQQAEIKSEPRPTKEMQKTRLSGFEEPFSSNPRHMNIRLINTSIITLLAVYTFRIKKPKKSV